MDPIGVSDLRGEDMVRDLVQALTLSDLRHHGIDTLLQRGLSGPRARQGVAWALQTLEADAALAPTVGVARARLLG